MSINGIANNIAKKIVIGLECEQDRNKEQVIAYGLFAIIHTLISIVLVAIGGALFGVLLEALAVSFVIAILRKASGGAHMNTPWACAFSGAVVAIGFAVLSISLSSRYLIIFGIIFFTLGYIIIYGLAPVDSKSKPIKKAEKRQQLKKKSLLILSVYLMIVIGFMIPTYVQNNKEFIKYIWCIYWGIGWQVLTLTRIGHTLIGKIDIFFNILFK